jgi:curved DNA-binding protein CbpA
VSDHYKTLGVSENASADEVKSAFRRIARENHPDVSSSDGSKEVFLRAKEAYEVLNDPERRRAYDLSLGHARQAQANQRRVQHQSNDRARRRVQQAAEDRAPSSELLRMSMLLNSHRFREAEAVARQVLRIEPKSAQAYATLAEAARVRGDLDSAARYFAYAAQYAPDNRVYREKSIEAQEALSRRANSDSPRVRQNAPIAVGAGAFVVLASSLYVVLAAEPPAFPSFKPIAAWPLSLLFMLVVAGLSIGVSLSVSGLLDVFDANRGSAVMRVAPATALGAVAVVSFWVALLFYVFVGATQQAFNASMSRLIGGVFFAVMVFTVAAYNLNSEAATQTFLWGGNVLYIAAAVGWFVSDSLKGKG